MNAFWELVDAPSTFPLSIPSPAWNITPNSSWFTPTNTRWISAFNYPGYSTNNYTTPYLFKNNFCICENTTVHIHLVLMCDDSVFIKLDTMTVGHSTGWYNHRNGNEDVLDAYFTLDAGDHNLKVELFNLGSVAMGFNLNGFITGANIL